MKPILDLTKAIGNGDYFAKQFGNWGDDKNILFVNPQLSGKCLYKMILPFFSMFNEKVATAITGMSRYDYEGQLLGGDEIFLEDEMIEWADFIVFPFTTQPLVSEFYARIRNVKEDCKVIFLVDFNFYELSSKHPFREIFDEPTALSAVEDNIWFSDVTLTSNAELATYLVEKFKLLGQSKYAETVSYLAIACMPYMIDTDIVLKNVEYDPMKPVLVNPNEHNPETKKRIDEVAETADAIKEADLADKKKLEEEELKRQLEEENAIQESTIPEVEEDNNEVNKTVENGNSKSESESGKGKSKPADKRVSKPKSKPAAKPKPKPKPAVKSKSGSGRKKGR